MKTLEDGRWRGDVPLPVPDGMKTLTRKEAAEVLGVDQRVITRYVSRGLLLKYVPADYGIGRPGAIVFDAERVAELRRIRGVRDLPEPLPPTRKRW